jgi:hypothetical protein
MSLKTAVCAACTVALIILAWNIHEDSTVRGVPAPLPLGTSVVAPPQVTPLWFQADGRDDPASVENDTPFPNSHFIVNAQWTTPRYYPNPKVQKADIIPVTWADDGYSYVMGMTGQSTVPAEPLSLPALSVFRLATIVSRKWTLSFLHHDTFLFGCPKSVTPDSCYSVGLTEVNHTFYAPTYNHGYPVVGDHYRGHARIDYSPAPLSQTSWVHRTVDFPEAVGSGTVSFVEIGQGVPAHDGCSATAFPHGCIYAIVSEGGYQDAKDPNGIDQFIATELYLALIAVGTREHQYQEVTNPLNWQWFAGFDRADHPMWTPGNDKQLDRHIRSLSFPRQGRSGCRVVTVPCLFWEQPPGHAGHVNYPHMANDRALGRYLLTFGDYYYRDFQPPTVKGPMVQGGAELIVLEAPHPWGPWSFVMRSPYLGSGSAYSPSFPVQWEGLRTATGQDLWMIWAANFSGCDKPLLVPSDLCQGVYGMNLRRLHLTVADTAGAIPRPWYDQDVGFASPGSARFQAGAFEVVGNGSLALRRLRHLRTAVCSEYWR